MSLPIIRERRNPYDRSGPTLPFTLVGPDSPLAYRKAVERLAVDFAANTQFGHAPYSAQEAETYSGELYSRARVLLFSEPLKSERIRCFGAVGIRWKCFNELPEPGWVMTWAWFHSSRQRKGYLRIAWPYILKLFPNLIPEPPITLAMLTFLKRVQFNHPIIRLETAFPYPYGEDLYGFQLSPSSTTVQQGHIGSLKP
jgi:hypothetical protein